MVRHTYKILKQMPKITQEIKSSDWLLAILTDSYWCFNYLTKNLPGGISRTLSDIYNGFLYKNSSTTDIWKSPIYTSASSSQINSLRFDGMFQIWLEDCEGCSPEAARIQIYRSWLQISLKTTNIPTFYCWDL